MKRAFAVSVIVLAFIGLVVIPASPAVAGGSPPNALQFTNPNLTANAGSSINLTWQARGPGEFFLLTSTGSNPLPNFDSSAGISWPSGSSGSYNSTYGWWSTTSSEVTVTLPASATQGTEFDLQLLTCNLATGQCSVRPVQRHLLTVRPPSWWVRPRPFSSYIDPFETSIDRHRCRLVLHQRPLGRCRTERILSPGVERCKRHTQLRLQVGDSVAEWVGCGVQRRMALVADHLERCHGDHTCRDRAGHRL